MPRGRPKKEKPVLDAAKEKELFDRLVSLHKEINGLNEDLKALKLEVKEAGGDPALLSKAAALFANSTVYDAISKNEELKVMVEKFDSE